MAFQPPRPPSAAAGRPHVSGRSLASLGSLVARVALTDMHADALRSLEHNWNSEFVVSRSSSSSSHRNNSTDIRSVLGCGAVDYRLTTGEALVDQRTARRILSTFALHNQRQPKLRPATADSPTTMKSPPRASVGMAQHILPTVQFSSPSKTLPRCSSSSSRTASPRGRRRLTTSYAYPTGADGVTTETRHRRYVRTKTAGDCIVSDAHHLCPCCAAPIVCDRPVSHYQRVS